MYLETTKTSMNERLLALQMAMRDAIKHDLLCEVCEGPITGPKRTIVMSTIPTRGEVLQQVVIFRHMSCEEEVS